MEYAIVDIETTGSFAEGNRMTEIAIVIHDGRYIIDKFETLINPLTPIPFHIQMLTGINDQMVEHAPTFDQIADKVYGLLAKRVFVAHNVGFDYSFIVNEFKQVGINWNAPKLCTVRLARKIIPNLASYSLGKLCHNLGIPIQNRHRAMGDVLATVTLFELLQERDQQQIIQSTLRKTKEQRLPSHIDEENFKLLPETTGVYLFRNKAGKIIYVGKAVNIRKRVLGHFTGNNNSSRRQAFINDIYHIDFEESGTELMALLMECQMIKKHWPIHNRALKKFEPKFVLLSYEDQKGYLRLVVSKFEKNMEAIQFFERAMDANQLLLQLINTYHLDTKLCSFYTTALDRLPKRSSQDLPDLNEHNTRVEKALADLQDDAHNFMLFDRGRHLDEKSYIYYRQNRLHAFGFVHISNQSNDIEDIVSEKDLCNSNYYMNSLVLQYAERFPNKMVTLGKNLSIE